jgi:hypothetical protein
MEITMKFSRIILPLLLISAAQTATAVQPGVPAPAPFALPLAAQVVAPVVAVAAPAAAQIVQALPQHGGRTVVALLKHLCEQYPDAVCLTCSAGSLALGGLVLAVSNALGHPQAGMAIAKIPGALALAAGIVGFAKVAEIK